VTDRHSAIVQREALLDLAKALGCAASAFRRDECGDPRINGSRGHVYALGIRSKPNVSDEEAERRRQFGERLAENRLRAAGEGEGPSEAHGEVFLAGVGP